MTSPLVEMEDSPPFGDLVGMLGENQINNTELLLFFENLNRQQSCARSRQLNAARCEESDFHRFMMGYGFLVLCFIAVVGNCLNLLVYISDQIRFFIAIRMLCTKLLVNTLTMLVLLPQALRSIGAWVPGSLNDKLYFKYWPYQAFFVNVFGFTGMWLTVLMTAECYLHVFLPLKSKSICTMKNVLRSYFVILIMAILLGMIYPLNRSVVLTNECDMIRVTVVSTPSSLMSAYERFHMMVNMLFALVAPLGILVFMTTSIVWRLVGKAAFLGDRYKKTVVGRFSTEKRSVTQITLITTLCQLFAELPSVPIFFFASVDVADVHHSSGLCRYQIMSQFMGLCNVSLSVFVYIAFSPRFRRAIVTRLACSNGYMPSGIYTATPSHRRSTDPSPPGSHCLSRLPPSVAETAGPHLIAVGNQEKGWLNVDYVSSNAPRFVSESENLL